LRAELDDPPAPHPSQIRDLGKVAGTVLNPAPRLTQIEEILDLGDIVLVMTVNRALAGRVFCRRFCRRSRAAALCDERGLDPIIEVDGGLSGVMRAAIDAGADGDRRPGPRFSGRDYGGAIARSAIRRRPRKAAADGGS